MMRSLDIFVEVRGGARVKRLRGKIPARSAGVGRIQFAWAETGQGPTVFSKMR
jgi:hypothetical protein